MEIVKILGGIDLLGAVIFLMLTFGIKPFLFLSLIIGTLLLVKGMFIFFGEFVLSGIDLVASIIIFISIFLAIPAIIVWLFAFLLVAKGIVSFI